MRFDTRPIKIQKIEEAVERRVELTDVLLHLGMIGFDFRA
jgi:hypothetical protein